MIESIHPCPARTVVLCTRGKNPVKLTIVAYWIALGALFGVILAFVCSKRLLGAFLTASGGPQTRGISLDTLTYSAVEKSSVAEAYQRAMRTRFVDFPNMLSLIDPAEIILHRIIGEGSFGRVWSAKWRSSSVAVKEFVFAQAAVAGKSSMQREIVEEIIGEAGMMAMLRHPNVLQLFGSCLTSQAIWIVSELCSLGSLREVLNDEKREMPMELRLQIALHVAEGMSYLHTQEPAIIHRDLKSHNIFIHETPKGFVSSQKKKEQAILSNGQPVSNTTLVAKIGDWGSARAAHAGSRTMTHGVGTACWLAPEVIRNARSSKQSDIYSFGIVLWELATREEVYRGLETMQIIAQVANDNLRPSIPQDCLYKDLMVNCWDEDPAIRPQFDDIVIELNRLISSIRTGGSDSDWSSSFVNRDRSNTQNSSTSVLLSP